MHSFDSSQVIAGQMRRTSIWQMFRLFTARLSAVTVRMTIYSFGIVLFHRIKRGVHIHRIYQRSHKIQLLNMQAAAESFVSLLFIDYLRTAAPPVFLKFVIGIRRSPRMSTLPPALSGSFYHFFGSSATILCYTGSFHVPERTILRHFRFPTLHCNSAPFRAELLPCSVNAILLLFFTIWYCIPKSDMLL